MSAPEITPRDEFMRLVADPHEQFDRDGLRLADAHVAGSDDRDDGPPFLSIPSALDIAHYFYEETERTHGADGINLWREGGHYCYLWVYSMVDHDMWIDYLLEIRTKTGDELLDESRDFLFVSCRDGKMEVEWQNTPIRFDATTADHREHLYSGLRWFVMRVEETLEGGPT